MRENCNDDPPHWREARGDSQLQQSEDSHGALCCNTSFNSSKSRFYANDRGHEHMSYRSRQQRQHVQLCERLLDRIKSWTCISPLKNNMSQTLDACIYNFAPLYNFSSAVASSRNYRTSATATHSFIRSLTVLLSSVQKTRCSAVVTGVSHAIDVSENLSNKPFDKVSQVQNDGKQKQVSNGEIRCMCSKVADGIMEDIVSYCTMQIPSGRGELALIRQMLPTTAAACRLMLMVRSPPAATNTTDSIKSDVIGIHLTVILSQRILTVSITAVQCLYRSWGFDIPGSAGLLQRRPATLAAAAVVAREDDMPNTCSILQSLHAAIVSLEAASTVKGSCGSSTGAFSGDSCANGALELLLLLQPLTLLRVPYATPVNDNGSIQRRGCNYFYDSSSMNCSDSSQYMHTQYSSRTVLVEQTVRSKSGRWRPPNQNPLVDNGEMSSSAYQTASEGACPSRTHTATPKAQKEILAFSDSAFSRARLWSLRCINDLLRLFGRVLFPYWTVIMDYKGFNFQNRLAYVDWHAFSVSISDWNPRRGKRSMVLAVDKELREREEHENGEASSQCNGGPGHFELPTEGTFSINADEVACDLSVVDWIHAFLHLDRRRPLLAWSLQAYLDQCPKVRLAALGCITSLLNCPTFRNWPTVFENRDGTSAPFALLEYPHALFLSKCLAQQGKRQPQTLDRRGVETLQVATSDSNKGSGSGNSRFFAGSISKTKYGTLSLPFTPLSEATATAFRRLMGSLFMQLAYQIMAYESHVRYLKDALRTLKYQLGSAAVCTSKHRILHLLRRIQPMEKTMLRNGTPDEVSDQEHWECINNILCIFIGSILRSVHDTLRTLAVVLPVLPLSGLQTGLVLGLVRLVHPFITSLVMALAVIPEVERQTGRWRTGQERTVSLSYATHEGGGFNAEEPMGLCEMCTNAIEAQHSFSGAAEAKASDCPTSVTELELTPQQPQNAAGLFRISDTVDWQALWIAGLTRSRDKMEKRKFGVSIAASEEVRSASSHKRSPDFKRTQQRVHGDKTMNLNKPKNSYEEYALRCHEAVGLASSALQVLGSILVSRCAESETAEAFALSECGTLGVDFVACKSSELGWGVFSNQPVDDARMTLEESSEVIGMESTLSLVHLLCRSCVILMKLLAMETSVSERRTLHEEFDYSQIGFSKFSGVKSVYAYHNRQAEECKSDHSEVSCSQNCIPETSAFIGCTEMSYAVMQCQRCRCAAQSLLEQLVGVVLNLARKHPTLLLLQCKNFQFETNEAPSSRDSRMTTGDDFFEPTRQVNLSAVDVVPEHSSGILCTLINGLLGKKCGDNLRLKAAFIVAELLTCRGSRGSCERNSVTAREFEMTFEGDDLVIYQQIETARSVLLQITAKHFLVPEINNIDNLFCYGSNPSSYMSNEASIETTKTKKEGALPKHSEFQYDSVPNEPSRIPAGSLVLCNILRLLRNYEYDNLNLDHYAILRVLFMLANSGNLRSVRLGAIRTLSIFSDLWKSDEYSNKVHKPVDGERIGNGFFEGLGTVRETGGGLAGGNNLFSDPLDQLVRLTRDADNEVRSASAAALCEYGLRLAAKLRIIKDGTCLADYCTTSLCQGEPACIWIRVVETWSKRVLIALCLNILTEHNEVTSTSCMRAIGIWVKILGSVSNDLTSVEDVEKAICANTQSLGWCQDTDTSAEKRKLRVEKDLQYQNFFFFEAETTSPAKLLFVVTKVVLKIIEHALASSENIISDLNRSSPSGLNNTMMPPNIQAVSQKSGLRVSKLLWNACGTSTDILKANVSCIFFTLDGFRLLTTLWFKLCCTLESSMHIKVRVHAAAALCAAFPVIVVASNSPLVAVPSCVSTEESRAVIETAACLGKVLRAAWLAINDAGLVLRGQIMPKHAVSRPLPRELAESYREALKTNITTLVQGGLQMATEIMLSVESGVQENKIFDALTLLIERLYANKQLQKSSIKFQNVSQSCLMLWIHAGLTMKNQSETLEDKTDFGLGDVMKSILTTLNLHL